MDVKWPRHEAITHIGLVLRLRMNRGTTLHSPYIFMACCLIKHRTDPPLNLYHMV
jgi:hypothetical protein